MNRLAIFVEGYTEVVFVEKLIYEIAGKDKVIIESKRIRGGAKSPRTMTEIQAARPNTGENYYILIYDCEGDHQVKSRILEEHENLTKKGYSGIIGMRDVRPQFNYSDIPKLELNLPKYIKTKLAPVTFILAVMEIEAWFLAETNHFLRIDPAITLDTIRVMCGFDPETDDMEQRLCPADDLQACYAIGGKTYVKGNARDTIDALDFGLIYIQLQTRIKYLNKLITTISNFLY